MLYLYILCTAYGGTGYYVPYSDDFVEDAALDIGCTVEKIGLMVSYLLDKSLLDGTLFNTVKALSSHGIQTQYQLSKQGSKQLIEVDSKFWILEKSETREFIKVRLNENSSEKKAVSSEKKSTKESKENKRKEKESNVLRFTPPALKEVTEYCSQRKNGISPQRFIDYYEARGWKYSGGVAMKDWRAAVRLWEQKLYSRTGISGAASPTEDYAALCDKLGEI